MTGKEWGKCPLSGIPGVGEGEQLEGAVMYAIPTCEDSCGDGGGCFSNLEVSLLDQGETLPYGPLDCMGP